MANQFPGISPIKTNATIAKNISVSKRLRDETQIRRSLGIRRATEKWESKKAARIAAEKARDDFYNTDVDQIDFMTMSENASEDAKKKYKALCDAAEQAKTAEQEAIKGLWSAKYDTMSDTELQDAAAEENRTPALPYRTVFQNSKH